jgi:hypothetical protein
MSPQKQNITIVKASVSGVTVSISWPHIQN